LSLIGSGAGVTIIGPEDPEFHSWPGRDVFIINAQQAPGIDISGMTLEHSPWMIVSAMYVGTLVVAECSMSGGGTGIRAAITESGEILNCEFNDLSGLGIIIFNPTSDCSVGNCTFTSVLRPVKVNWSPAVCDVSNCEMEGGGVGVSFSDGASGSVTGCTMRGFHNYGVGINSDGDIVITNNVIEQSSGWGMFLGDADNAFISQNVITTETGTCLFLPYPCDGMVFEGNDLYRGDGNFAKTNEYWPFDPPTYFHVENNYWGTTDAEEISEHILDGNNMENVNMFVVFEPFEDGPVPTEQKTWSELKSMYR